MMRSGPRQIIGLRNAISSSVPAAAFWPLLCGGVMDLLWWRHGLLSVESCVVYWCSWCGAGTPPAGYLVRTNVTKVPHSSVCGVLSSRRLDFAGCGPDSSESLYKYWPSPSPWSVHSLRGVGLNYPLFSSFFSHSIPFPDLSSCRESSRRRNIHVLRVCQDIGRGYKPVPSLARFWVLPAASLLRRAVRRSTEIVSGPFSPNQCRHRGDR
jgi:hypothetical protein